jgi:hypothetical protein
MQVSIFIFANFGGGNRAKVYSAVPKTPADLTQFGVIPVTMMIHSLMSHALKNNYRSY